MYKQGGKRKLGKKASHRKSMIHNQLRSLFKNGYVTTTTSKAKVLKANAESLLTKATKDSDALVLIRDLATLFNDVKTAEKLMKYAPKDDAGVRIVKIGFRAGDNAEVSKVTLIDFVEKKKVTAKKSSDKKEEKKVEVEKDGNKPVEVKRSFGDKLAKSIKSKMPVSKERARSRSGL